MTNNSPIGIIDSGVGGFTVARSVQRLLPSENLIYLGDGANAPYGNRTGEELISLAKYTVGFMMSHQVKLLLIACNTISCLAQHYEDRITCPVLYVVKSGARGIATQNYQKIGVISTNFTHQQQMYARSILEISPEKQVLSQGSTHLVRLIEERDSASSEAICQELRHCIDPLLAQGVECCVLGCTHYPLAEQELQQCYPNLPFSDPAEHMAIEAAQLLREQNLENHAGGRFDLFTTGEVSLQAAHLKRAGLAPTSVAHHPPLKL